MEKIPVFEIARSFSKTVQVKAYSPENYFCSAKESFFEMPSDEQKKKVSEQLYSFCKDEVMKSVQESQRLAEMTVEDNEELPF